VPYRAIWYTMVIMTIVSRIFFIKTDNVVLCAHKIEITYFYFF